MSVNRTRIIADFPLEGYNAFVALYEMGLRLTSDDACFLIRGAAIQSDLFSKDKSSWRTVNHHCLVWQWSKSSLEDTRTQNNFRPNPYNSGCPPVARQASSSTLLRNPFTPMKESHVFIVNQFTPFVHRLFGRNLFIPLIEVQQ